MTNASGHAINSSGTSQAPNRKLFEISQFFHAFKLPSFDLTNPSALAATFGRDEDADSDTASSSGLDDSSSMIIEQSSTQDNNNGAIE